MRYKGRRTADAGVEDPGKYDEEDDSDDIVARQTLAQQYVDSIQSRNVRFFAEFDIILKSSEETLCSDFLVLSTCTRKPREQKGSRSRALFHHPVVLSKFVHGWNIRRELSTARHPNGHLENELE